MRSFNDWLDDEEALTAARHAAYRRLSGLPPRPVAPAMVITFQIPATWICWLFGHQRPIFEQARTSAGALQRPHRIRWICPRCHRELGASS